MTLNYPQKPNGMYSLKPADFDDIARAVLRENNLASVIESPKEVDILYLIKECLYLDVYSKNLSPDKSVMGLMAFHDSTIPCYDLRFKPTTFDVVAGNIVIDMSLSGQRQLPRRRFTLAHELAHWILHRSYHSPTNQVYALRKQGYLSCKEVTHSIRQRDAKTDSEKEEAQANALAAALLMPKGAFLSCATIELRKKHGQNTTSFIREDDPISYKEALEHIASVFNVSFQATEIRLDHFDLLA